MATIDDLKAAIEKLGDRIEKMGGVGGASKSFERGGTEKTDAGDKLPGPQRSEAEQIGAAVARAFGNIPALRDIARQVGYFREILKQVIGQAGGTIVGRAIGRGMVRQDAYQRMYNIPVSAFHTLRGRFNASQGLPRNSVIMMDDARMHDLLASVWVQQDFGEHASAQHAGFNKLKRSLGMMTFGDPLRSIRRHQRAFSRSFSRSILKGHLKRSAKLLGQRVSTGFKRLKRRMSAAWPNPDNFKVIGYDTPLSKLLARQKAERDRKDTGDGGLDDRFPSGKAPWRYRILQKAATNAALADFTTLFGVAAGGVVASLFTVGVGLLKFSSNLSQANRAVAGYSPTMAAAYALSDIRDLFRDMQSAQRRAPAQAAWLKARGAFLDATTPAMDNFKSALQTAGGKLLTAATPAVTKGLNLLTEGIQTVDGTKWAEVKGILNQAEETRAETGKIGPRAFFGALSEGNTAAAARLLKAEEDRKAMIDRQIKKKHTWDQYNLMDLTPWGDNQWQPDLDEQKRVQENIDKFKEAMTHPEDFKGKAPLIPPKVSQSVSGAAGDVAAMIRDAINTMKELTNAMKDKDGKQMMSPMPASIFMAGVASTPTMFSVKDRSGLSTLEAWKKGNPAIPAVYDGVKAQMGVK